MKAVYHWFALVVSSLGLGLSGWIVIPAPTFLLLPLSVGAPEVSPWLLGLNALGALLSFGGASSKKVVNQKVVNQKTANQKTGNQSASGLLSRVALGLSVVGALLCLLPFSQLSATNQRAIAAMAQGLGTDYLAKVPLAVQAQMRSQPFVLTESLSGIPELTVRYTPGISFKKIPKPAPEGVEVISEATPEAIPETISDDAPLTLDLYRPPQVGQYPALVVIYGGAWQTGSPLSNADFSRYMAARGYVVWAISYRHAPRYQFPTQLEDVEDALSFLRTHAAEYETDPDRVALLGRSAGAQLAMLAAYRPGAPPIKAVVDYYGPVDLAEGYYNPPHPSPIDTRMVLTALLGGAPSDFPQRYASASPINFVSGSAPPTLLVYGGRDNVVQSKYGRAMHERLLAAGNQAVFLEIPWADHAFDSVFNGISNQLALYYTERFLAWALLVP